MIFPYASGPTSRGDVVPWTPTYSADAGSLTTVTTDASYAYRYGQFVFCYVQFTMTNIGTASGALYVFTPTLCRMAGMICGTRNSSTPIAVLGFLIQDSSLINTLFFDNTTVIVTGAQYAIHGWYSEWEL